MRACRFESGGGHHLNEIGLWIASLFSLIFLQSSYNKNVARTSNEYLLEELSSYQKISLMQLEKDFGMPLPRALSFFSYLKEEKIIDEEGNIDKDVLSAHFKE